MHIYTLELKGYRAAADLTLDLHPHINVFFGQNGAGKSTVLDAAAVLLSWAVSPFQRKTFIRNNDKFARGRYGPVRVIERMDVHTGSDKAELHLTLKTSEKTPVNPYQIQKPTEEYHLTCARSIQGIRPKHKTVDFSLRIEEEPEDDASETFADSNLPDRETLHAIYEHIQDRLYAESSDPKDCPPVLMHYSAARHPRSFSVRLGVNMGFEKEDLYEEALSGEYDFKSFFRWFRVREDIENEEINIAVSEFLKNLPPEIKNDQTVLQKILSSFFNDTLPKDAQLDAVEKALSVFLPHFTDYVVKREALKLEVKKNGLPFFINQLSQGEKTMIAMIGDIARRLAMANAKCPDPLQGYGVVMIDEVDLHLHPEWQRRLIPGLIQAFPNVQFLLTTHSPHVLTHVKPEEGKIFSLSLNEGKLEAEHIKGYFGRTAEVIEQELMDIEVTRPDEAEALLDELRVLVAKKNYTKAREELEKIREKIGNDGELIETEAFLEAKRILEK